MNRILFLSILFCILSAKIFGQAIAIAPKVTINIGVKPEVSSSKQMKNHFKGKSTHSNNRVEGYKDEAKLYKIGNSFVDFQEFSFGDDSSYLENTQKKLDDFYGKIKSINYRSKIEIISNKRVLIRKYDATDHQVIAFIIENPTKKSGIKGSLRFDSADEIEADQTLKKIVKGIKFN